VEVGWEPDHTGKRIIGEVDDTAHASTETVHTVHVPEIGTPSKTGNVSALAAKRRQRVRNAAKEYEFEEMFIGMLLLDPLSKRQKLVWLYGYCGGRLGVKYLATEIYPRFSA
jgi:hypothetical protein